MSFSDMTITFLNFIQIVIPIIIYKNRKKTLYEYGFRNN